MRKIFLLLLFIIFTLGLDAAGPKGIKKLRAAQVSVVTYTEDGSMREGQGFFLNSSGAVVTDYDLLKGAVKAMVIDSKGKEYAVSEIAGASALYNVVKLHIVSDKKKFTFIPALTTLADSASVMYIMPSSKADKKVPCMQDTVIKVQNFDEYYSYYSLKNPAPERLANSPVLNEDGQLVGILHLAAKEGSPSFVLDSKYADSLTVKTMDATNVDLKSIRIKKALPQSEQDASSFIYLSDRTDTLLYPQYIEEFISRYPSNAIGYTLKTEYLISHQQYNQANEVYQKALEQEGIKKDEILFSRSKSVYDLCLTPELKTLDDWNMEFALSQAEMAYQENPLPTYTQQQAMCLYALKKYTEAADKFSSLSTTTLRSADMFVYAAQSKQMAKADSSEILALMDSAMACYEKPYPASAAKTILIRALTLGQYGKYRDAVLGYNDYERLANGNLTANFYYEREQLEVKCRMYPAALNDIEKAMLLAPREPLYCAEAAALNYRVGQLDDAITYCQRAIALDASFSDAYRIMGLSLNQQGKKEEARKQLLKAKELGDALAEEILKKLQ